MSLFQRTACRSEGISTLVPKDHQADDEMPLLEASVRLVDLLNHFQSYLESLSSASLRRHGRL